MNRSASFISLCLALLTFVSAPSNLAAKSRKDTAVSYVELGDKFASLGHLDQAIGAYNIALEFAPTLAVAYLNRGNAHEAWGDFNEAIADYSKTIELSPQSVEAYCNRAYVLVLQDEAKKAFS